MALNSAFKYVYVLVSNNQNIYTEQMWASIHSLRIYNPKAHIEIITDTDTQTLLLTNYATMLETINNIVVCDPPKDFTLAAKSRFLKTSIRNIISGDYLFLDTDTIICGDLSEIEQFEGDILCVNDLHVKFSCNPYYNINVKILKKVFKMDVSKASNYFNSGVMLVRDNDLTRKFYKEWHNNWLFGYINFGLKTDQQSLLKTDFELNSIITPLSGIYNCQVTMSVKFLHEAKIMHFFNNLVLDSAKTLSIFLNGNIYKEIKKGMCINKEIENSIINCKQSFNPISPIIGFNEFLLINSSIGQSIIRLTIKDKRWIKFFNILSHFFNLISKMYK